MLERNKIGGEGRQKVLGTKINGGKNKRGGRGKEEGLIGKRQGAESQKSRPRPHLHQKGPKGKRKTRENRGSENNYKGRSLNQPNQGSKGTKQCPRRGERKKHPRKTIRDSQQKKSGLTWRKDRSNDNAKGRDPRIPKRRMRVTRAKTAIKNSQRRPLGLILQLKDAKGGQVAAQNQSLDRVKRKPERGRKKNRLRFNGRFARRRKDRRQKLTPPVVISVKKNPTLDEGKKGKKVMTQKQEDANKRNPSPEKRGQSPPPQKKEKNRTILVRRQIRLRKQVRATTDEKEKRKDTDSRIKTEATWKGEDPKFGRKSQKKFTRTRETERKQREITGKRPPETCKKKNEKKSLPTVLQNCKA